MIALALTGGGARGAYQAGVIQGLIEILCADNRAWPFPIITGTSAGAINATFLATELGRSSIADTSKKLGELWANLRSSHIYKNDPMTMAANGLKWLQMLSAGGLFPSERGFSLLRTDPLRDLLERQFDFPSIAKAVSTGVIKAVGVTAVSYSTGVGRTFFYAGPEVQPWDRHKREGIPSLITAEHVLASSAIPILFPPVKLGQEYYGDGSLRDYTPLSASIHLGGQKLLVIGVRKGYKNITPSFGAPGPAKIFSMILNGLLLDALDLDLERINRINDTVGKLTALGGGEQTKLKKLDILTIAPSEDIGTIASEHITDLSRSVQYFLSGLGGHKDTSDLASYILFEGPFTRRLLELGKKDVHDMKDEIKAHILG